MSKQKVQVPKGYKPSKIEKIGRPTGVTEEQILTWHALKSLEESGMLPKGYLTKVRNNRISYESARKYAIKTLLNANCPFKMRLVLNNNDAQYYIFTFVKVA
jgi:hypothetical protein